MQFTIEDLFKITHIDSYKSTILSAMNVGYKIAFSNQYDDKPEWNENTKIHWYSDPVKLIQRLKYTIDPCFLYFKNENESFEEWSNNGWVLIEPYEHEERSIKEHNLSKELEWIVNR